MLSTKKIMVRQWCAIIMTMVGLMLTTGCDVHEFPTEIVGEEVAVMLHLHYAEEMSIYKEINVTRSGDEVEVVSTEGDYDVRYVVEFYRKLSGSKYAAAPTKRIVLTTELTDSLDCDIAVSIEQGSYRIIAWTDYVVAGTTDDMYYDTNQLATEVALLSDAGAYGDDDMRDAFKGMTVAKFGDVSTEVDIAMERPLAKYVFIADNFDELVSRHAPESLQGLPKEEIVSRALTEGLYRVLFYYESFMPSAYDIVHNYNADAITGAKFSNYIRRALSRNDEVMLGFDYVFMSPTGGSIDVRLIIYDEDGNAIGESGSMIVPLQQNGITIVRGSFITPEVEDNSGIGLSPDFIGPDYNIRI